MTSGQYFVSGGALPPTPPPPAITPFNLEPYLTLSPTFWYVFDPLDIDVDLLGTAAYDLTQTVAGAQAAGSVLGTIGVAGHRAYFTPPTNWSDGSYMCKLMALVNPELLTTGTGVIASLNVPSSNSLYFEWYVEVVGADHVVKIRAGGADQDYLLTVGTLPATGYSAMFLSWDPAANQFAGGINTVDSIVGTYVNGTITHPTPPRFEVGYVSSVPTPTLGSMAVLALAGWFGPSGSLPYDFLYGDVFARWLGPSAVPPA